MTARLVLCLKSAFRVRKCVHTEGGCENVADANAKRSVLHLSDVETMTFDLWSHHRGDRLPMESGLMLTLAC